MRNDIQLGLKENWRQFTLLVIINAFVAGMIGLEGSIFPRLADEVSGVEVYPTFLAAIAENPNPLDRAHSIGIFRLWRDFGYPACQLQSLYVDKNIYVDKNKGHERESYSLPF